MLFAAAALGSEHHDFQAQKLGIALLISSLYPVAGVKLVLVQLPPVDL